MLRLLLCQKWMHLARPDWLQLSCPRSAGTAGYLTPGDLSVLDLMLRASGVLALVDLLLDLMQSSSPDSKICFLAPYCTAVSHITKCLFSLLRHVVWAHWSCSFCCGPQGEALGFLDTLLWYTSTRAQQQTLHLPSMVCTPLPGGPSSHIRHTPFLDTCFLIFLVTFFAVSLASDFVPTRYDLKLWPGLTIPSLLVTFVMVMMYRMSNTFFSLHPSTRGLSPKDLCFPISFRRLKQCACFSGPGNNKLYFFLHALIVFFDEQASSRTSWLKAFFL